MKGTDRFIIIVEVLTLLALGAWGSVRVVNALGFGSTGPSSNNFFSMRVLGISRNLTVDQTPTPEITGTPQPTQEMQDQDEQMTGTVTPEVDEDLQEKDEEITGMPNPSGTPGVNEDSQGQNSQDGSDGSNQSGGDQNNSGGGDNNGSGG